MSNQAWPTVQVEPCCTPLVREPLTEDWAGDLARMFKALSDLRPGRDYSRLSLTGPRR
jgi:ArsR family transcriptional regulator, arsenate/arsenite/antimonite-responsive transcriptional repressor